MPSITDALNWMIDHAERDNVGYSMDFREYNSEGIGVPVTYKMAQNQDLYWSYGGYANNYRQDYATENETHEYYDCSSAIFYALKQAGYAVGSAAFATGGMDSVLTGLGFTKVSGSALIAGDIGVYNNGSSGHTWMITAKCNQNSMNVVHASHRNSTGTAVNFKDQFLTENNYTHAVNYFYRSPDSEKSETDPETLNVSLYCVAAMAGNFYVEAAGLNPAVWEFSATEKSWTALLEGYGLAQWTNTNDDIHGRLYQLYQWMTANGYAMTSGTGQVRYIFEENVWHTSQEYQSRWGIYSLKEFLTCGWTDIDNLTECWMDCFEGVQSNLETRQSRAQTYFDYISDHKDDDTITKWIYDKTGGIILSDSDAENNAVMLYRCVYNNCNEYGYTIDGDYSADSGNTGNGGYSDTSQQFDTDNYSLIDIMYALMGGGGSSDAQLIRILRQRR